ncbi:DUF3826 domain-containing protein [Rhizosphaericola mali]|uniref:DUF3826 domain-containing protein n=1 Tax=Rhizosphaericola mali TaxID=2545455 RepID=A0A5P2G464_9BACT|nr:DUF3826 domain-containing protein [Rhizosphaericola mali]QES88612.1 DUF3826 domain-containing protein [Rhizosphaericola mali]
MKKILMSLLLSTTISFVFAQKSSETYKQTIQKRADKIVAALNLTDSSKFHKVCHIVADQYEDLNDVYIWRDSSYNKIKRKNAGNKDLITKKKADVDSSVKKKIGKLHTTYLNHLNKQLNPTQVDEIKNGMTYNVSNITYKAYQDMIPSLTEKQKKQLWIWLVEARENAMDAESSDKKHAWFGKFKGRINNYLSAQGYDIQKERKGWEERIKANNY